MVISNHFSNVKIVKNHPIDSQAFFLLDGHQVFQVLLFTLQGRCLFLFVSWEPKGNYPRYATPPKENRPLITLIRPAISWGWWHWGGAPLNSHDCFPKCRV